MEAKPLMEDLYDEAEEQERRQSRRDVILWVTGLAVIITVALAVVATLVLPGRSNSTADPNPLSGSHGLEVYDTSAPSQPIDREIAEIDCAMAGGCASSVDDSPEVESTTERPTPTVRRINESLRSVAGSLQERFEASENDGGYSIMSDSRGGYCGDSCTDSTQCAGGMACFNGVCWNAQVCESGGSGDSQQSGAQEDGRIHQSSTDDGDWDSGGDDDEDDDDDGDDDSDGDD